MSQNNTGKYRWVICGLLFLQQRLIILIAKS